MQVVERKHHIDFTMYGSGLALVKEALLNTYPDIQFKENPDEDFISSKESSVLKDIEAKMTAADVLSIRRENKGLTQKQLSDLTGIAVPNISLMENGSRKIGKVNAKKQVRQKKNIQKI